MLVLLVGIAFVLPSEYRVERSIVVNVPAAQVFPKVGIMKNWTEWMVWIRRDPDMKMTYEGPESGVGAKQIWASEKEGNGELTFTKVEPNTYIGYDLAFPDFGSYSKGSFTFSETGGKTTVTWADGGNLGMNPMMRYMGLFLDGMIGKDFDAGLAELKKRCEEY